MLYLHQYPGIWQLPSLSPFCIRVETYLRMRHLNYQTILETNPRRGPLGKMPVLRDDKIIIPDSALIIQYLEKKFSPGLDAELTGTERAMSHTIQRMLCEGLYFVILYSRWIDPVGKKIIDDAYRQFFPRMLAPFALKAIRHLLKKQGMAQGTARHDTNTIYQMGCDDIHTLAELLGEKKYILGDTPHTVDATVFAFLAIILYSPLQNPLLAAVKARNNLQHYTERLHKKWFTHTKNNFLRSAEDACIYAM